jgi:hypothetical protein
MHKVHNGFPATLCGAVLLASLPGCADVLGLGQYDAGGAGGAPTGGAATGGTGGDATGGNGGNGGSGGSGGTSTGGTSSGGSGGAGGAGGAPECMPDTEEACYDGPPGSDGIAACKAGKRTCDANGQWGPCDGQVVPKIESCDTKDVDESCDDHAACTGAYRWAKAFGEVLAQAPTSIAVDAQGNAVVVGHFGGTFDFDGPPLTVMGGADLFVVKLDREGKHLWSKSFGSAGDERAFGVALDASGNVFVVGEHGGGLTFGGDVLMSQGGQDFFVAKLAPDGTHLWSKSFGGPSTDNALAVAVDPAGDVLVAGFYEGAASAGSPGLPVVNGQEAFLAKYSGVDGAHVWSQGFAAVGAQTAVGVAVDPGNGAAVVVLQSTVALDFGQGLIAPPIPGGTDIFVARYDKDGVHQWSHPYGGPGEDLASDVAIGLDGSAVIAATSNGNFDVVATSLPANDGWDLCYWKINAAGLTPWASRTGPGGDQLAGGVTLDAAGNVLLYGSFTGNITFGTPLTAAASSRYLAKLGPNGAPLWASSSAAGDGGAGRIAADPLGNIVFASPLLGTTDYGGGPLASPNAGDADVLIGSLTP